MKKTVRIVAALLTLLGTLAVTSSTASAAPKRVHEGTCLFPLHGGENGDNGEVEVSRLVDSEGYLEAPGVKEVRYQSNGKIVTKLQCTSTIDDLLSQLYAPSSRGLIDHEKLAYTACHYVHFVTEYYPADGDGVGHYYGDLVRAELKVRDNGRVDLVCRWHAFEKMSNA